jgi:hypothetical protein
MQSDFLTNISAWALALLVYPGFLFALALAMLGRWLVGVVRPLFTPRLYRGRPRISGFLDPLLTLLKLLARKGAVRWQAPGSTSNADTSLHAPAPAESALVLVGAIAPLLALALMPVSGNPVAEALGVRGDLFLVLALLAVYPLASAAALSRGGGFSTLAGAQTVGALLTGFIPTLLLVTALVQVAGATNLNMDGLLAAPQTPQQTFVRLLCGVALLVVLPWWLGRRPSHQSGGGGMSAAAYAGRHFQAVALAVLWSRLILPTTGDMTSDVIVLALGALFASVVMSLVGERWWPTRRTTDAANLVWATTLPVAGVALMLSLL